MDFINHRILRINLSSGSMEVDNRDELFYRKYAGGSALGLYYCLSGIPRGCDPLEEENVLCFSTSIVTGAPISCLSRFSVNTKSPITGGIADSQCGGYWGPELKFSGYDALIISGRAPEPVYIFINRGEVKIMEASRLWGLTTGETEERLREKHGDKSIRIASIGKAGENLVRYANIMTDCSHACGRTGVGAVMGSKNLKAVAVKGDRKNLSLHDSEGCKRIARMAAGRIKTVPPLQGLSSLGTSMLVTPLQRIGCLPTKNFKMGVFEAYDKINGEALHEHLSVKSDTCFACSVRCKRVVSSSGPVPIDPLYGGPEYETLASFGSYLMVDDIHVIAKANELCNKYGLDTISTGSSIAFAMECNEKNILDENMIDGERIEFGNKNVVLPLIEKIADRTGIGRLLAEGPARAAAIIGRGAEGYAIHVKGNPLPAHMPRIKRSMSLIYSVNPFGADHMSSVHDAAVSEKASEEVKDRMRFLGIYESSELMDMDSTKIRFALYTQIYCSLLDSLCGCAFGFSPSFVLFSFRDLIEIIRCATGLNVSSWELMKIGERRMNMMRLFNERCGFSAENDTLPSRMFEEFSEGPAEGVAVDRVQFEESKKEYYELAGWDPVTGNPRESKIKELGLEWALLTT